MKRLDEFSLALLLPIALARHLRLGTSILPRRAVWALATLFAIGGIASIDQGTASRLVVLDAFLLTKGLLVFVIVSAFVPDDRVLRTTMKVMLGFAAVAAVVGLVEIVAPGLIRSLLPLDRAGLRLGRVAMVSLFDNEGQAGWFFAFFASACLGFYQVYRSKGLLGLVALFTVCALLTLRRKPIGGLLLVVLASALLTKQTSGKLRVVLVMGLLLIALTFAFGDTVALVLSEGLETYVEVRDPTAVARTAMYIASYRIAVDHFPLGVGFGLFGGYASQLQYSPVYQAYGLSSDLGAVAQLQSFHARCVLASRPRPVRLLRARQLSCRPRCRVVAAGPRPPGFDRSARQGPHRGRCPDLHRSAGRIHGGGDLRGHALQFLSLRHGGGGLLETACHRPCGGLMRVLLLSNMYPSRAHPSSGIFVRNQVRALEERHGVQTTLVVSRGRAKGWPAKFLKYIRLHLLAWARSFRRHDVVHLHYASPAHLFAAWPALLPTRTPVVVTVHGGDVHSLPRRGVRRRWVRLALRRAAAVVAASRDLKRELIDELGIEPGKIEVIDVGCDLGRFAPASPQAVPALRRRLGLPAKGTVVLFVGHLNHGKGLDILLAALEALPGQSRLTLLIVGSGPLRERLAAEFAARVPAIDVRWLGEVEHSLMGDCYRAADLLVLPSRNEGRPAAILEAMACGTAVLASRVGGIPEIIEHGASGLLFDSERSDLLSSALDRLISDRDLRTRLAGQALRDAQSHSLVGQSERVHAIYRKGRRPQLNASAPTKRRRRPAQRGFDARSAPFGNRQDPGRRGGDFPSLHRYHGAARVFRRTSSATNRRLPEGALENNPRVGSSRERARLP